VCKYFSLCVVFVCVFVNIFVKKNIYIYFTLCIQVYPVRSNADTVLRSNSLSFVRAQSPLHTHTLQNAFDRMRF
jgi:hypothetical protein